MASPRTEQPRSPSIRDVARVAGVSHQTVSRVLNNSGAIRDETRERVRAAMEQLQYRPNRAARALVTSRTHTIGVLTAQRSHYGPAATMQAIEDAAVTRGYSVTTANIADATDVAVRDGLGHLLDQDVEGIIVIAPQQRVFDLIEELGMRTPYVALRTSDNGGPSTLFIDQMEGARLATAHLLDLGHEYVRHIAGPQDWIEAEARMQGFLREMSDRDMPVVPPIREAADERHGQRVQDDEGRAVEQAELGVAEAERLLDRSRHEGDQEAVAGRRELREDEQGQGAEPQDRAGRSREWEPSGGLAHTVRDARRGRRTPGTRGISRVRCARLRGARTDRPGHARRCAAAGWRSGTARAGGRKPSGRPG